MTIYSNKLAVNVTSSGGGGGGGGGGEGTLPAKFQIASTWYFDMPVSMIRYVSEIDPFLSCFYVSDYYQDNPCCGSKPSGHAFTITGKIVDAVGNPVPNQPYLIYLLNPDPNMRIIDYVTGNNAINPSQSNPLNAKSDSNGNMNLGIVYYGYPNPDKNNINYPAFPLNWCNVGNAIPEIAASDNIAFQIPGTAIQGQTVISIAWKKYYITILNPLATSCPTQSNSCLK
jgi:hypothetical protein